MELKDLVGRHVLSGVERTKITNKGYFHIDSNAISIVLDGVNHIFEEDPDDGYRSYLDSVSVSYEPWKHNIPDVEVVCYLDEEWSTNRKLLHFQDATNGKDVLIIGTDYTDYYYPVCIMWWDPKNLHVNE